MRRQRSGRSTGRGRGGHLPGPPRFNIVGLPDSSVQESRERVRAAIRNSGAEFPMRRITVSLAPADIKKTGPSYDLPIAIGILVCSGQVPDAVASSLFLGELALDGKLRSTHGMLPMLQAGKDRGYDTAFVPNVNAKEASLVPGIEIRPTETLKQLVSHLRDGIDMPIVEGGGIPATLPAAVTRTGYDFRDVRGQEQAKRALEIAAAGHHNIVLMGAPGCGKTLLARCLPSIMPPMTPEEALEVTTIYSVTGLLPSGSPLITNRPFRAPHYTISNAGLIGGGSIPRPGEVTLSHRGVLFLDELPEFGNATLETLRQPLEDRSVTIQPSAVERDLSGELHDGRSHEPLSVRLLRRFAAPVHLWRTDGRTLPTSDFGPVDRPHRHVRRRPARRVRQVAHAAERRGIGGGSRTHHGRGRTATRAIHRIERDVERANGTGGSLGIPARCRKTRSRCYKAR